MSFLWSSNISLNSFITSKIYEDLFPCSWLFCSRSDTSFDFVQSIKFRIALSLSRFDSSIFLNFIAVCSVRTFTSLHRVKKAFSLQSRVNLSLFKASTSGRGILFQFEASRALPIVRDVGLQQSVSLSLRIFVSNLVQSAICFST